MEAAGTQKQTPRQERSPARHSPRRIGWQEFQKRYLTKETGYKYEWVDGLVEKTAYTMNPDQLYIQYNLQEVFMRLSTEGKVNGQLLAEADLLFAEKLHRQVHVYSGTGLRHSTVLSGDDLCSAAPALPDFSIRVEDIFKTA